jgi:hypothetical protein
MQDYLHGADTIRSHRASTDSTICDIEDYCCLAKERRRSDPVVSTTY